MSLCCVSWVWPSSQDLVVNPCSRKNMQTLYIVKDWAFINTSECIRLWQAWKGDGWKSVHSPISLDSPPLYPGEEFWRSSSGFKAQNSYKKVISHWRKGPTKILLYSLESSLQKRKNGKVGKGLLTSKHLKISSSEKNFTAGHWTPSWNMKRNESEIF